MNSNLNIQDAKVGAITKVINYKLSDIQLPKNALLSIIQKDRVNATTGAITKVIEICNFGRVSKNNINSCIRTLIKFQISINDTFNEINKDCESTGRRALNPYKKFINNEKLYFTDKDGIPTRSIVAKNEVLGGVGDRLLKITKANKLLNIKESNTSYQEVLSKTVTQIALCYHKEILIEQIERPVINKNTPAITYKF